MPAPSAEQLEKATTTAAAITETAPLLGTNGTTSAYDTAAEESAKDEYIISLIRKHSTNNAIVQSDDDDVSLEEFDDGKSVDSILDHQTTYAQTLIHLIKGYIGCGILSLPWAISQLGIPFGLCGIVVMSLWSSYNCWTVVKLKRFIERNELQKTLHDNQSDDGGDVASSIHSATQSIASSQATSNVTYPDVGEWAHGVDFQNYVAACICTQQLAICTVFMSFVGENLYAVLQFLNVHALDNHEAVISVVMPIMMALCFLPSLKSLAPVMLLGTILIFAGFGSLGIIGALEWENRPDWEDIPTLNAAKAPMALCGILYSFEGICIILPVESAMKEPQHFKSAFWISMSVVTMLLCAVAGLSVLAFGEVDNGSITAFLLEEYKDDDRMKLLLMMCNLLVSVSIVLTYPLQLFPAIELVAPMAKEWMRKHKKCFPTWLPFCGSKEIVDDADDDSSEHDLEGFEPMTEIPEHEVASLGSLPSQSQYHDYGADTTLANTNGETEETAKTGDGTDNEASLSRLSSMGYQSVAEMMPEWQMPGDSPALRAVLVLSTYVVAMVVPNVESLVSLAGAVAGSSTALLIPPILELAWIKHMEEEAGGLGDWEGGPSAESKTTLVRQQLGNGITTSPAPPRRRHRRKRKSFLKETIISWFLLCMGIIFAAFGSYFSVQDIVETYLSPEKA